MISKPELQQQHNWLILCNVLKVNPLTVHFNHANYLCQQLHTDMLTEYNTMNKMATSSDSLRVRAPPNMEQNNNSRNIGNEVIFSVLINKNVLPIRRCDIGTHTHIQRMVIQPVTHVYEQQDHDETTD